MKSKSVEFQNAKACTAKVLYSIHHLTYAL